MVITTRDEKEKTREPIAALAEDLRHIAKRAYNDFDNRAQEVLALNQLYKKLSLEVKFQLCTSQYCRTITEVVEIIERSETILGDTTYKKSINS